MYVPGGLQASLVHVHPRLACIPKSQKCHIWSEICTCWGQVSSSVVSVSLSRLIYSNFILIRFDPLMG